MTGADPFTAPHQPDDVDSEDLGNAADDLSSLLAHSAGRSARRKALMRGGTVVVVLAIAITAVVAFFSRSSGNDDGAAAALGTLDAGELADLDAFLAEHPDDVATRLTRGRSLVESGDLSAALDEYMAILDSETNAEALAFVGWITYASGETALAEQILEQSLEVDPQSLPGIWFLANVRFYGTEDIAGAVPLLEQVVAREDAEADMVEAARGMLAEADAS